MERKNKKFIVDKYDALSVNHEPNKDADACYNGLDSAFFSFECSSDFDSFLNGLQNKINVYRKMRAGK